MSEIHQILMVLKMFEHMTMFNAHRIHVWYTYPSTLPNEHQPSKNRYNKYTLRLNGMTMGWPCYPYQPPGRGAAIFSHSLCWHDVVSRAPWWMWWDFGLETWGAPQNYPPPETQGFDSQPKKRETNGLMGVVLMGIVLSSKLVGVGGRWAKAIRCLSRALEYQL